MNELKLLLVPATKNGRVHEGVTKSGTTRFLTEIDKEFIWIDCETGENYAVPFYAQGVELAGEKGVGNAETYAEKNFLLSSIHPNTATSTAYIPALSRKTIEPRKIKNSVKIISCYIKSGNMAAIIRQQISKKLNPAKFISVQ